MFWPFTAARRLRALGILGMNERNAACILDHNPRGTFPLVDDKLRMHALCRRLGVPSPDVYGEIGYHSQLRRLPEIGVDAQRRQPGLGPLGVRQLDHAHDRVVGRGVAVRARRVELGVPAGVGWQRPPQ